MLENVTLPVVLTGSQLPLADPLSDGLENIRTALEMCIRDRDSKIRMQKTALRAVFLIVFEGFPVRKNRYEFPRVAQVDV